MSSDPVKRLLSHNQKKVFSTKKYTPFELIYTKEFTNRLSARDYEKFLKISSNKEKLLTEMHLKTR